MNTYCLTKLNIKGPWKVECLTAETPGLLENHALFSKADLYMKDIRKAGSHFLITSS